jgi:hypothetical protein
LIVFIFNLLNSSVTNEVELVEDELDEDNDTVLELDEERDELIADEDEELDDGEREPEVVFEELKLYIKKNKTKILHHFLFENTYTNKSVPLTLSFLLHVLLTACERERRTEVTGE